MSDRMDNEQLKAKIGQILYNEFITGRLRDEVLSQFAQRGTIDLSYSLGRDSNGDEIFIEARVFRVPTQLDKLKQEVRKSESSRNLRKYVIFLMSNEKTVALSDESLRNSFDNMLGESLPWWDRYHMRGGVDVRDWRLEKTIVASGKNTSSAMRNALKLERRGLREKMLPTSVL